MRIVGEPGDTVEMHNGVLSVNAVREVSSNAGGSAAPVPTAEVMAWQQDYYVGSDKASYRPTTNDWGPLIVPERRFFVLGDNRGESYDSRFKGLLPTEHIHSQARTIYFSRDPSTKAIRWSRIGRTIR